MYTGAEYWKNCMQSCFGAELIEKWKNLVEMDSIGSNNRDIHLDVYDTSNSEAETIILLHGIAGYTRLMLPYIIPLREKGYNVVVPDLQGYGYSGGKKGDFEWKDHINNILDTIEYAEDRFDDRIVLSGVSMGAALTYAAACETDILAGIVCWCLWDIGGEDFISQQATTGKYTFGLIPIFRFLSSIINFRIKLNMFIDYNALSDSQELIDLIINDPKAGRYITLKGAASLIDQSQPAIEYKNFDLPALVFQPEEDQTVPKIYTKQAYDKLGSHVKKYVELKGAPHFPVQNKYYQRWAEEIDKFITEIL